MRSNAEGWPREISGAKKSISKDGYTFSPDDDHWQLNKDVIIYLGRASELPEPTQHGFRSALKRYAEELSAKHTENMATRFNRFLRDTGTLSITAEALMNWRADLGEEKQWYLGGLKGFLLAWHDYGFPGVPTEVAELLQQWRIKGNDKGKAVLVACPETGPLTDLEIQSLLDWANMAAAREQISFRDYAYLLTLAMTARRPVQIAALRGKDLLKETSRGIPQYKIRVPRAKQRGGGFRHAYRTAVIEDLYQVLNHQYHLSLSNVERAVGGKLEPHLRNEIPVFINHETLASVTCASDVADLLTGERPDALHVTVGSLARGLQSLARLSQARSERTGEFIRLSAVRFRHTRGTKLRRDGFGAYVIAELLDHSDIQNVRVYCENTAQEAAIIDEYVGAKLAPFAQACMGTLVWSEPYAST